MKEAPVETPDSIVPSNDKTPLSRQPSKKYGTRKEEKRLKSIIYRFLYTMPIKPLVRKVSVT